MQVHIIKIKETAYISLEKKYLSAYIILLPRHTINIILKLHLSVCLSSCPYAGGHGNPFDLS